MKLFKKKVFLELDVEQLETYPSWQVTDLMSVRINDKKKESFTDCHFGCIVKNGRVRFSIFHEKGYPSQEKGTNFKSLMANWLNIKAPKIK